VEVEIGLFKIELKVAVNTVGTTFQTDVHVDTCHWFILLKSYFASETETII